MGDFVGVVPAIATPMGQDGRFNEEVFRKIVEFNNRSRCTRFLGRGRDWRECVVGR